MATMRVVQVSAPNAALELVERDGRSPARARPGSRSRPAASATATASPSKAHFPGITYPRVPGHEIAGVIDALGEGTEPWRVGQRVGVGWYGGHCGHCDRCRRGDFVTCREGRVPGISYDGGYAEYMVAPARRWP